MKIVNLYKYEGERGEVIITPNQRNENDIPHMLRLIADEGMELVNEDIRTCCVDVYSAEGWVEEIEIPEIEEPID